MQLLPAFTGTPEPNQVYNVDALTLLRAMPSGSVDLIATDWPYNMDKAAWDTWKTDADYLEWMRPHLAEMRRVLKPNGSYYGFASPRLSARVEVLTSEYFNILNNIRWIKEAGWHNRTEKEIIRGYLEPWETIIFAEHFNSDNFARGESSYVGALDDLRGFVFEPLRSYLDNERVAAGISFEQVRQIVGCAPGSGLPSHWFTKSQWVLPTREQYEKLQRGFNDHLRREYDHLRREYEDLRREYEDLRRPFNVSADVPYTDVWDFATVNTYPGKHPCEKPAAMMQHIIEVSSRPGALVLDCFCGSGATLKAAYQLGRDYIGCDMDAAWCEVARNGCVKEFGARKRNAVTALDDLPLFSQKPA